MEQDRFVQRESGVFVPSNCIRAEIELRQVVDAEDPSAHDGRDQTARFFNLASIIIQLVTVVVLWLTFKNTVVPIQQKEFLAEQVAGLERDKIQTLADIKRGKVAMGELNDLLDEQRQELQELQRDRETLEADSLRANVEANSARQAAQKAIEDERVAKRSAVLAQQGLADARWRILSEEAGWEIRRGGIAMASLTRRLLQNAVTDANRAGTDEDLSAEERIMRDIQTIESNWPDTREIVRLTAARIRALRSRHYTVEMTEELARAYEMDGASFVCNRPDFSEIRNRYRSALASTGSKAAEETRAEMERIKREYESNGKRARFEDGWGDTATKIRQLSLEYQIDRELSTELLALPADCERRLVEIGSEFLELKTKNARVRADEIEVQ